MRIDIPQLFHHGEITPLWKAVLGDLGQRFNLDHVALVRAHNHVGVTDVKHPFCGQVL